jgi:hypothetical protein
MLAFYYIGRLDGRAPKLDIEGLMAQEIRRMTPADYDSEAKRCGNGLAEKGREITEIGKRLAEHG